MIVELSSSFDQCPDWDVYRHAVENLIDAHMHGLHIFLPTRTAIDGLLKIEGLSARQRATLRSIQSRYSELGGLARQVGFTVLAVANGQPLISEQLNQRKRVALNWFSDWETLRRFQLLVENAAGDGVFLGILCESFKQDFGFSHSPNLDLRMGGGATIAVEFARLADSKGASLCVVDSDRAHPADQLGSTAKAVKEVEEKLNLKGREPSRFCDVIYLNIHEMENFVPISIYKEVLFDVPEIQGTINMLEILERHDKNSAENNQRLRYLDLKNGLSRDKLRLEGPQYIEFHLVTWKICCPNERDFDVIFFKEGQNIIINPMPSGLLIKVIDWLDVSFRRSQFRRACKSSLFWAEMEILLKSIFAFSASMKPQRT